MYNFCYWNPWFWGSPTLRSPPHIYHKPYPQQAIHHSLWRSAFSDAAFLFWPPSNLRSATHPEEANHVRVSLKIWIIQEIWRTPWYVFVLFVKSVSIYSYHIYLLISLSHRFVGVIAGWIFVNLCRPWHPRNFVARWANFGASARKPMAFCAGNVVGKYGFKTFQAPWKQWKCVSCVWPDVSAISSNFDPDCHTYREKSYDGFSKWMVEIIENQMIFVWAPPSFEKLPNEVFLILSFNSWFWMPQLHRTTPPHSKLSHAGKAGCGMRQLTMSLDSLGGSCPAREYPLKTDLQHLTTNWKWSYLVGPWMNFR